MKRGIRLAMQRLELASSTTDSESARADIRVAVRLLQAVLDRQKGAY